MIDPSPNYSLLGFAIGLAPAAVHLAALWARLDLLRTGNHYAMVPRTGPSPIRAALRAIVEAEAIDQFTAAHLARFASDPPAPAPGQFRCDQCGAVSDTSDDDEARAEAIANGFDPDLVPCGVICDDCYALSPWGASPGKDD